MSPLMNWNFYTLVAVFGVILSSVGDVSACKSCHHTRVQEQPHDYVVQQTQAPPSTDSDSKMEKVWLFAVSGRRKPYNFLDDNGKLVGFDVDFVSKVCAVARQRCEVVLAEFTECTFTERNINYPGRGVMAGWFDACPGYVTSLDRLGAFDFTTPYLATQSTYTVAPGNPSGFDPLSDDFSNFTFTHLTGAVTNSACLARLHKTPGNTVVADNLPVAKQLLLNRTADVLFSPRTRIPDLQVLPHSVHCDSGGVAVATKKGSPLPQWWDQAFRTLVQSGEFSALCRDSQARYNSSIKCLLPPQTDLNFESDRPPHPHPHPHPHRKVWLFAISGRRKPFAYLDDQGHITGFNVDLVHSVCAEAGQKCQVVLSPFTECSFTEREINYAGRGLMEGWFDGCPGYVDSLDRVAAADFTDAFLQATAYFAVSPGNPAGFDPDKGDYSNFTITHLTGAYTNAECLNRLKKKFGKILIAANLPEAKAFLRDGEADVFFGPRGRIPDLDVLSYKAHCEQSGSAIMVKRGSTLPTWWNPAYRRLVEAGEVSRLCRQASVKYGFPIKCLL